MDSSSNRKRKADEIYPTGNDLGEKFSSSEVICKNESNLNSSETLECEYAESRNNLNYNSANQAHSAPCDSQELQLPKANDIDLKSSETTQHSDNSAGDQESTPKKWTAEEDQRLKEALEKPGPITWRKVAIEVGTRDHVQCLQRWQKVLRPGLVKGQWSPEEDSRLLYLVSLNFKNWGKLCQHMPGRTSKQCRERWCHHLDPGVVKTDFTREEDALLLQMQATFGNKWAQFARVLPGRTENSVKIRYKSLERMLAKQKNGEERVSCEITQHCSPFIIHYLHSFLRYLISISIDISIYVRSVMNVLRTHEGAADERPPLPCHTRHDGGADQR